MMRLVVAVVVMSVCVHVCVRFCGHDPGLLCFSSYIDFPRAVSVF
jgi:hypothetical protein